MSKVRLPQRALGRLDLAIREMAEEDKKSVRRRDSRVYAYGRAIVETYGLLLDVPDPSDEQAVRVAVVAALDPCAED